MSALTFAGVYAAVRSQLAALTASFEHLGGTLEAIRDDLHEMRTELRTDLDVHSRKLDSYGQRIARHRITSKQKQLVCILVFC